METEHHGHSPQRTSFFQDPQKLTFALGLMTGLAAMSIAGIVLMAVNRGGASASTRTTTTAGSNTNGTADAGTPTNYDPVAIAEAIGLNASKFRTCLNAKQVDTRIDRDLNEGGTAGVNGTPTSFVNGTAISGALPYSQIKSAVDAALAGAKGTANVPAIKSDDHVIGPKKPKLYFIEYSDFQCPFCKQFAPTVAQVQTAYKDQVAIVYRHFPLESIHPYARSLAEGSECAAQIGGEDAFWKYHDQVFGI